MKENIIDKGCKTIMDAIECGYTQEKLQHIIRITLLYVKHQTDMEHLRKKYTKPLK